MHLIVRVHMLPATVMAWECIYRMGCNRHSCSEWMSERTNGVRQTDLVLLKANEVNTDMLAGRAAHLPLLLETICNVSGLCFKLFDYSIILLLQRSPVCEAIITHLPTQPACHILNTLSWQHGVKVETCDLSEKMWKNAFQL